MQELRDICVALEEEAVKQEAETERVLTRRFALEDAAYVAQSFAANYPTDIFPEDGTSPDAIAARAIRRMAPVIADRIRDLIET